MRSLPALLFAVVATLPSTAVGEDLDPPDPDELRTASKAFHYETEHFSLRFGGGFLYDYADYIQDSDSKLQQPDLNVEGGIRDLRGLASGKLFWDRLTYTIGYMYDANQEDWRFRQTGLKLGVPELGGFLFVGRTKEGFSTNKFTVGYYGWTNERATANDAFIPILADGLRWTASALGGKLVYNVGVFADPLSEEETFNKNDWQIVGRAVWLPLTTVDPKAATATITDRPVLHLALEGRHAGANDGFLQYRSKPESFLAQNQAIDTGLFEAEASTMLGLEAYYIDGPFSAGSEYFLNQVTSDTHDDPFFHGGEVFAAYLLTGETHPYNARIAAFDDVVPNKSFFRNGPGAWELVGRASYTDLDAEDISGGRFFRATALLNWYLSSSLRLEACYGLGVLDREDVTGITHFFQTRVQLSIE